MTNYRMLRVSLLYVSRTLAAHQNCRQSLVGGYSQQGVLIPDEAQLSLFEQQLYGCRTFKAQPVPYVDTAASLQVTKTYTPEQEQAADAFTAAVSACSNFSCLQEANKLVRAGSWGCVARRIQRWTANQLKDKATRCAAGPRRTQAPC